MNNGDDELAPANMTDAELDNWLSAVNEDMCETLDNVVDTKTDLLRLKQQVAKEAMAVAQNGTTPVGLDQAIRQVLVSDTATPASDATRRASAPGRTGHSSHDNCAGSPDIPSSRRRWWKPLREDVSPVVAILGIGLAFFIPKLGIDHARLLPQLLVGGLAGMAFAAVGERFSLRYLLRWRSLRNTTRALYCEDQESCPQLAQASRSVRGGSHKTEVGMGYIFAQLWRARSRRSVVLREAVVRDVASMLATAPVVFVRDNPSFSVLADVSGPDLDRDSPPGAGIGSSPAKSSRICAKQPQLASAHQGSDSRAEEDRKG